MSVRGSVDFKLAFLAQDEASAVIAKLQKRMKDWSGQVKKGGSDAKELNVVLGSMKTAWTELNSKAELAAAAIESVRAAIDSVVVGEMESNVDLVFRQLADTTAQAEQGMVALRAAALGTVNDVALQQFANQMMFTGQKLDSIMVSLEAGSTIALATGQDVIQVSTAIAKAMNTGEAETLKNLGLTIDINREMREYARSLDKVHGTLTLAEKRVVIMNAVTDGLKKQMRAAGVNAQKFDLTLQETRTALENATSATGQFTAGLAGAGAEWITWDKQSDKWKESIRGQAAAILEASDAVKDHSRDVEDSDSILMKIFGERTFRAEQYALRVHGIGQAWDRAAPLARRFTRELGLEESRIKILTAQIAKAMHSTDGWQRSVQNIVAEHRNHVDELKRLSDRTEAQKVMQEDATKATAEAARVQALKTEIEQLSADQEMARVKGNQRLVEQITLSIGRKKDEIEIIKNSITFKQAEAREDLRLAKLKRDRAKRWKTARQKRLRDAIEFDRLFRDLEHRAIDRELEDFDRRQKLREAESAAITNAERARMANALRVEQFKAAAAKKSHIQSTELFASQVADRVLIEAEGRRSVREAEKADEEIRLQDQREANEKRMEAMTIHAEANANAFAIASGPMNDILADQGKRMDDWMIVTTNAFETVGEVSKIASKNAQDWTKGLPGMLSASSGITAGLIKDKRKEAAVRGAFEVAAGTSALFFNPAQAAAHFASAALFFALSGGAGKGSGKSKTRTSGTFGSGGAQGAAVVSGGPSNVVLNVNGFVSADQNQLAKWMQDTLSGIATGGFVGGTI